MTDDESEREWELKEKTTVIIQIEKANKQRSLTPPSTVRLFLDSTFFFESTLSPFTVFDQHNCSYSDHEHGLSSFFIAASYQLLL